MDGQVVQRRSQYLHVLTVPSFWHVPPHLLFTTALVSSIIKPILHIRKLSPESFSNLPKVQTWQEAQLGFDSKRARLCTQLERDSYP